MFFSTKNTLLLMNLYHQRLQFKYTYNYFLIQNTDLFSISKAFFYLELPLGAPVVPDVYTRTQH